MTLSPVLPDWYRSKAHFEDQERTAIFHQCWIFACLNLELADGKHVCCVIGDKSVVLQGGKDGKPRAYLNVCSHRQAQLCEPGGTNSGPLRCPYHGWVYDRDGVPVGIPQKHAFAQVIEAPQQFRLTEFACESAGEFVFVRLSSEGPALSEYLGSQFGFLLKTSQGMTRVLDEFRKDVQANWKVLIENSLEGYHVPAVHAGSFMQIDGMDRAEVAPQFYFPDELHSHLEHAADADWIQRFARMESKIGQWPWRFEHYTHRHIFPNLTITSFMGYSFHVQRFEPTQVDCTTVHSRTVGVELCNGTAAGAKMIEHIHADGHAFTRKVFDEDAGICRKVQAGLKQATRSPVLGVGIEDRVSHFHRAYSKFAVDR
ncbi:MAG: aromatic ring-hydroxylating dioxygenase subunit alpha [Proteobacteria bacterium]|nr:aromatic ring-hydroxylating dioxygenase subunit alpha [Pseudomonadota bacterium]